ncbi:thiol reductant ABC exporter subunit CydD [Bacillus altitudinis]|uniref:thiol reductant ABC exporter subunit CydD n=1 Tax=Bacillus altitudinis TaxID=293387 RepID=UPI001F380853|nr:thiol reductant ABC exporter subunit CydD [Bacillus altitudinis]
MLNQLLKREKNKLIIMGFCTLALGACMILQALFIVKIIDVIFLKKGSIDDISIDVIFLITSITGRVFFRSYIQHIGMRIGSHAKTFLRMNIMDKLTKHSIQQHIKKRTGKQVSYFLDTVDEVERYYSQYVPQLIQSLIIPVIILLVIFSEHWATGVILLITAPFIPVFMIIIGIKTGDKSKEQLNKMAAFSETFLDTLQGLISLKLFGRSAYQKEVIERSSMQFRDATMQVLKVAFSNSFALEFISMLSIGLVALEVSVRMVIIQDTSFTTGFMMLILAPEFFNKLKEFGTAFHSGKASKGAAKIIEDLLDEETISMNWGNDTLSKDHPPTLELKGAVFGYQNGFQSKPISIKISPYERVGIVGPTGGGKTTMLYVLAGLLPIKKGEYLVKGTSLTTYSEQSWFNQVSYIAQDAYLFSGTILDNILIGSQGQSEAEVIEAARAAGIEEWIRSLPQQFHTPIGEGGRGLSGGEKQRILIARAFLKKSQIILFDEPTSGMDLETERIVQNSLDKLSRIATVITVAHRLHTIQKADQVILLHQGEIRMSGTHRELLEKDHMYKEMVSIQRGNVPDA